MSDVFIFHNVKTWTICVVVISLKDFKTFEKFKSICSNLFEKTKSCIENKTAIVVTFYQQDIILWDICPLAANRIWLQLSSHLATCPPHVASQKSKGLINNSVFSQMFHWILKKYPSITLRCNTDHPPPPPTSSYVSKTLYQQDALYPRWDSKALFIHPVHPPYVDKMFSIHHSSVRCRVSSMCQ